MYFIDLAAGETVTPAGRKSQQLLHLVEAQKQEFEFAFIRDKELYTLPENAEFVITGDVCEKNPVVMFIAYGTLAENRQSVKFVIDTYTREYCQRVTASNTPCLIDISFKLPGDEYYTRLVRFTALADARLNIEGNPPQPLQSYYTRKEIDQLLKAYQQSFSFADPQVEVNTLSAGTPAAVAVDISTVDNVSTMHFSFDLPTGPQGAPGEPGEPGASPVRGVDYWTDEDVAGLKDYIDNAIINGEW